MLAWRNQPANREVSVHQHEIDAAEHRAWWDRVQDDPTREVHMFEVDDRALGVVTFFDIDRESRSAGWGFYLDNVTLTAEGLAMVAWMRVMGDAVDHAFDVLDLDLLTGEVLEHNEAVRLMNRRFKFTEGPQETREVDGHRIVSIPISLARADRRTRRKR